MKSIRIIKNYLLSICTWRTFAIFTFVFTFQFGLYASMYGINQSSSLLEILILMFYGPFNHSIELFRWLFHQVPVIVMIGYFIDREIKLRTLYILPRIGSIHTWLAGISVTSFVFTFLYYLFGLGFTLLLIQLFRRFFNSAANSHHFRLFKQYESSVLLLHLFFLLVLSTFAIILIYLLLSLLIRNVAVSFSIVMMSIAISTMFTNIIPEVIRWLPSTQGMFIHFENSSASFLSSYVYLIIVIVLLLVILCLMFKQQLSALLSNNDDEVV